MPKTKIIYKTLVGWYLFSRKPEKAWPEMEGKRIMETIPSFCDNQYSGLVDSQGDSPLVYPEDWTFLQFIPAPQGHKGVFMECLACGFCDLIAIDAPGNNWTETAERIQERKDACANCDDVECAREDGELGEALGIADDDSKFEHVEPKGVAEKVLDNQKEG